MKHQVLESLETAEGDRCVDLFRRPDGSYGFEIYRRDSETLGGWFAIGGTLQMRFGSVDLARAAAARLAPWISP